MKWMLDTNACIGYISARSVNLQQRLDATNKGEVGICSVVKAELYFGSARSNNPVHSRAVQDRLILLMESLPFDDAAAERYAIIRRNLAAAGTPIGGNDLLIAAIAVANDVILVTHNASEFSRVPGLKFADRELPQPRAIRLRNPDPNERCDGFAARVRF